MTGKFDLKRMKKEWTGFYTSNGQQIEMRIDHLNMNKGMIKGSGEDSVGAFTIQGTCSGKNKEVNFVKAYIGKHTVNYQGWRQKKDIVGMWAVGGATGEFKISKGYDDSSSSDSDNDKHHQKDKHKKH